MQDFGFFNDLKILLGTKNEKNDKFLGTKNEKIINFLGTKNEKNY